MVTNFGPGTYRIQVIGRVNKNWPDFAGFSVTYEDHKDYGALTVISGEFPNQRVLIQFLSNLLVQGFPVISVERLKSEA